MARLPAKDDPNVLFGEVLTDQCFLEHSIRPADQPTETGAQTKSAGSEDAESSVETPVAKLEQPVVGEAKESGPLDSWAKPSVPVHPRAGQRVKTPDVQPRLI